ncbi:MAG: hypothetical protein U9N62_11930 [Thermotogota bacterium]|nr:hypothetical protein [Thermotogota bacterium]
MAVEVEKKFILSAREAKNLKNNFNYSIIGIIQWYLDGAKDPLRSERIRMILSKDGTQQWISGKKECINGNLIRRIEKEKIMEESTIRFDDFSHYPFIIKTRTILNTPFKVEVVLDKLLKNPYLSYDVEQLLEIELEDETDNIDWIVQKVFSYFDLNGLKDVSSDFDYTNQIIAFRAKKRSKEIKFTVLLDILKKEMRSDLDEKE